MMDCRVKPGNDGTVNNSRIARLTLATAIVNQTPPGTSGLLAFGREKTDDGSTRSSDGLDDRRKRLLFRCCIAAPARWNLILGRFVDTTIADLTDANRNNWSN